MRLADLKYLGAYLVPLFTFTGLALGGIWTFTGVVMAFFVAPALESVLPTDASNYSDREKSHRLSNRIFDTLLYLNLPMVWTAVLILAIKSGNGDYSPLELTGLVLSVGTLMGANGINVAHELGHRRTQIEQLMAKLLLLPSLYMHFFIEHNRGHHRRVGTPEDPATARYNENVYSFWMRCIVGSYKSAWALEALKMKNLGISTLSIRNEMVIYAMAQLVYLGTIFWMGGWVSVLILSLCAVVSILLLETINYIEHYGLMRQCNENGVYEPVKAVHSWNSNHYFGRIMLFELTRHSDHHYKSDKKYQILESHENSPQLRNGYPASMLMSLAPPLWFSLMNPQVDKFSTREHSSEVEKNTQA